MKNRTVRLLGIALFTAVALATTGVITMAKDGGGGRVKTVEMKDDCDPATFNAPDGVGPGTCVGEGETTFAEFIAELQQDRVADDWEFDPDDLDTRAGQTVRARNTGGELHTFTEVAKFGGGVVPPLNALSHNNDVAPECFTQAFVDTSVFPGGVGASTTVVTPGKHRFQCCIHPWMRTVVTVGK
jgi:plastocyanin